MRDYEAQGRLYVLGFGSVSNDRMDSSTLEMVRAGDHCDLRMSRQIAPGGGSANTLDQYRRLVDEQVQPNPTVDGNIAMVHSGLEHNLPSRGNSRYLMISTQDEYALYHVIVIQHCTCGGEKGYVTGKLIPTLKMPPSYTESDGPMKANRDG